MSKFLLALLPLVAMSMFTFSCNDTATQVTEKSCSELGDSVKSAVGTSVATYKVIRPNGGEVYHVGDTLKIRATENLNSANAVLYLQVGSTLVAPPNLSASINFYSNCDMSFVITDSLSTVFGSGKIASVSDSVKVLVENYTTNTYRDFSDGVFQIKAHAAP